jgi:hypothetical protein
MTKPTEESTITPFRDLKTGDIFKLFNSVLDRKYTKQSTRYAVGHHNEIMYRIMEYEQCIKIKESKDD